MMLPLNIGIFAEYEKRFEQRKMNMVAWFALQKFVETMGDYPDRDWETSSSPPIIIRTV